MADDATCRTCGGTGIEENYAGGPYTEYLVCACQGEGMNQHAADEIERLRAAIDSLLHDIDGDHIPEWASDEAKAAGKKPWCCRWCGPQDGSWPCGHRMALDELKEARRER